MAIVKATYTRKSWAAKASVRYIENRPGRNGVKLQRTLFNADGKVQRSEAYIMIDQASENSYFFRLVISPDPKSEDEGRNLSLRELTERTMRSLEDRFQRPLQWVAAIHADQAEHRHIHTIAILPERLIVQDFQRLRAAATEAALEQLQHLDLQREARMQGQEHQAHSDGLEIGL
jgi:hypothetical protein